MRKYIAVSNIALLGELYYKGEVLHLDEDRAKAYLDSGMIRAVKDRTYKVDEELDSDNKAKKGSK